MRMQLGLKAILAVVSVLSFVLVPWQAFAQEKPAAAAQKITGDPYTLDMCPVTGEKLGTMGDPVVKVYDGREVRFCCGGCPAKFEKDLAASFKALDEKFVAQQKAYYPLDTCLVTGEKLGNNPVAFVFGNRLFLLCCKDCENAIKKDPAKYFEKLDNAVKEKQGATYALKTCPVSGKPIEGKGVEKVVANRLIRFCCENCPKEFDKNPAKYLPLLDKPAASKPK